MSIDTTKKISGVDYKGTDIKLDQPDVKGLADGTLTEFVASDYGVTSLKDRRFYQFTNLQKLDLTGVTNIPEYTAQNCTGLTELVLDPNTTNIGQYAFSGLNNTNLDIDLVFNNTTVQQYSFQNARVRSISGNFADIRSSAFASQFDSNDNLTNIDIKINGTLEQFAFSGHKKVQSFKLDKNSIISNLGGSVFQSFGISRTNPENNLFIFDFRNSTFTQVGSYCFNGMSSNKAKYFDIYFPSTLTSIQESAFSHSDHYNIYYKSLPTLSNIYAFNDATNFKNFFPYNLVQTAKNSTNWSSTQYGIVDSIYGYAEENEFELGDTLPDTDADGYALTWYSDREMTNQVTTVTDPTQIYYCQVGSKIKVPLTIAQYQATLTVSDGVNTYTNGDLVPIGANLIVTAVGDSGYQDVYLFTLNGTTISSGYTYTVTADDINITCIYWDGVNKPFGTVFADNTPQQIKDAVDAGVHRALWTIGDSIPVTLTNGLVGNIYYIDQQANRYEKVDGNGYSNAVFEFRPLVKTAQMNTTGTNAGGWASSRMNTVTMAEVYDLLPSDWKTIISEVKVPSATSGRDSTIVYANNKTFIPSGQEIFGSSSSNYYNEGCTQFDWYVGKANADRIRQYNGTNTVWWLRSPYSQDLTRFCMVRSSGDIYVADANGTNGVCVCLAI